MVDDNQKLIQAARKLTWINPVINVLKHIDTSDYNGLVKVIEDVLQKENNRKSLLLPELKKHTETLAIFSDYGGEAKDSNYLTYSFLVCDFHVAMEFITEYMQGIRNKHNLDEKEISFKDLRFGPLKRSLKPYLESLDKAVPGFLFTVVIEKKIQTVFGATNKKIPKEIVTLLNDSGYGKWKTNTAEKLLRIVHISAYLTGLFSKDGQKLFWMTDHDSIAPNEKKQMDMLNLFSNTLSIYTKNKFDVVGGAVPFDSKNMGMLDLLSSTDLVSGAIEHYLTRKDNLDEFTIKKEADEILQWLGHDGVALKKRTILIKSEDNNSYSGGNLVFKPKALPEGIKIIPIAM